MNFKMNRSKWFWICLFSVGALGGFFVEKYIPIDWHFTAGMASMILIYSFFEKRDDENDKIQNIS